MNKIRLLWWKFNIRSRFSMTRYPELESLDPNKKRCFVCLAADYGNLGDVAITYAQEKYLSKKYPDYEIVDWPISKTIVGMNALKKAVRPGDIITIVGGGNMGDLYFDIELCRLLIIKKFPKNKIIVFPQSYISVSKDKYLAKLNRLIYQAHNKLTICAREEVTFDILKSLIPKCDIRLIPDIVFSLNEVKDIQRKNIFTLCLRNDDEKVDHSMMMEKILTYAQKGKFKVEKYDTHLGYNGLSLESRSQELQNIWNQFSKSKLVVTDRLHGMIFAYITGTPALILRNNNFKIIESFRWIQNCGFIKVVQRGELLDIDSILNSKPAEYKEISSQFINLI